MKGKYHIRVHSRRILYDIDIERNITLIRGDSGTGKTEFVNMVSRFLADGESSGITIECDVPIRVVTGEDWELRINSYTDSIILIDEGHNFIKSVEFARCVNGSSNYFILITREDFETLPYSVHAICEFDRQDNLDGITHNISKLLYMKYSYEASITPSVLITEDRKSGYQFFSKICESAGIQCVPANGKSNIYSKLLNITEENIAVIADGSTFGSQIGKVLPILKRKSSVLLLPESFEWLILKSGIIKGVDWNVLEYPYNYIECKDYLTWKGSFIPYWLVLHRIWSTLIVRRK